MALIRIIEHPAHAQGHAALLMATPEPRPKRCARRDARLKIRFRHSVTTIGADGHDASVAE